MLLSILLVVGVVSSNDTGYEGECLEEVVTLRRKVRLMETLHKQMEEKGKRLTLEHELLERDLQKKTEEVEELREAMRQAEEELPLSSAGTDKEKVRDLQGKVGALQHGLHPVGALQHAGEDSSQRHGTGGNARAAAAAVAALRVRG